MNENQYADMDIEHVEKFFDFILSCALFASIVCLFGLVASSSKNISIHAFYLSSLVFGALFAIVFMVVLSFQCSYLSTEKLYSLSKRNWLILYAFRKDILDKFQVQNGCCGWVSSLR